MNVSIIIFSGFESETDTEEFENVGQSPIERRQFSSLTIANTIHQYFQSTPQAKPEIKNITTSTDVVRMQSIDTLTEVIIIYRFIILVYFMLYLCMCIRSSFYMENTKRMIRSTILSIS